MHLDLETDLDDAEVLGKMAHHLRKLSEEVAQVAKTVSDVTEGIATFPSNGAITRLQKIDSVQQSLWDLAQLSDALACNVPTRATALQKLKLAETRALLVKDSDAFSACSGTVDLF
ncbi:hypothetical protein [Tateyamaria sp.]|uniref:hypothetical protein n=1 Tax=Tateyamaria sp. TaxID=1929288 RepID=UPI0032A029F1